MEDDNTDNYNNDVNNGARHAKNGAEDTGHHVSRATGKGLNHAKNAPKRARQAAGLGTQGAGKGMKAAGAGMQGGGKIANGAGKGVQAAGQAAGAIPYAGPAIGGALDATGKGISGLGKGTDTAGRHLRHQGQKVDKAGKRIRNGGTSAQGAGRATSFFARLAAHGGLLFLSTFVIFAIILMLIFGIVLGGDTPQCGNGSDDVSTNISGTDGDWTKPGTKNYNGAKSLFAALKAKGANDTQAAGVVGALAHEAGGAFGVPDIAQGFYTWTSNPTEGNAGISSPGVASKAEASSGGERLTGASCFQYTPFTKYAPASDKAKWRSYPDLLSFWFKTQVPSMGESISDLKKCDSLSSAVQWTLDVEEGHGSQNAFSDRLSKAHQAYSAFKGTGGGSSDDASATADSSDSSCGGDESDSPDGTGSISEKNPSDINNWKWSQLPSDIKKYAHNPADAGMSYGSSKGWSDTTFPDQCVPFACSYFHAIWGLPKGTVGGNGSNMADSWHAALPGSTESKTPHAGAIAGSTYGPVGSNHTWIVLHVLSNGDTIVAEQNMVSREGHGGSGSHIGKPYTWDIGLRNKNTPDTEYTMPPKKYHLHWSK